METSGKLRHLFINETDFSHYGKNQEDKMLVNLSLILRNFLKNAYLPVVYSSYDRNAN